MDFVLVEVEYLQIGQRRKSITVDGRNAAIIHHQRLETGWIAKTGKDSTREHGDFRVAVNNEDLSSVRNET